MEFSKQKAAMYVTGYLLKELRTQRGCSSGYQLTGRHTHKQTSTTPALSIEQEAHFTQTTRNRSPVFTVRHAVSIHTQSSFTSKTCLSKADTQA